MRVLNLLVVLLWVAAAGPALAGPLEDAATAYGRGDYATAFRLWHPLAEQGSAQAQFNLGRLYENGQGVARDNAAALVWYRRAAEQGAGDVRISRATVATSDAAVPAAVTVLRGTSAPPEPAKPAPAPEAPAATVYREIVYAPYTPTYFLTVPLRTLPHRMPMPAPTIGLSSTPTFSVPR